MTREILVIKVKADPKLSKDNEPAAFITVRPGGVSRCWIPEFVGAGFPPEENIDLTPMIVGSRKPTGMYRICSGGKPDITIPHIELKRGKHGFPTGISFTSTPLEFVLVVTSEAT
jgi:hypothetical protein